MAHKVFETKPGVKLLISTEKSNNLTLIFTSEHFFDYQGKKDIRIEYGLEWIDRPMRDFLDHNGYTYANYMAEERFEFIEAVDGHRMVIFNYPLSIQSLLDHLQFHHAKLYWHLLS